VQVQNSISMELLPQAAAAAAAAEQLLGASPGLPGAAAAGMLSPRAGAHSPFAAVDAEVFVCSPRHPLAASSPVRPSMQQQQHRRGTSQSRQQQQAAAALERQLSRVVSAKPSFAQPIAELRLVGRWVLRAVLCWPSSKQVAALRVWVVTYNFQAAICTALSLNAAVEVMLLGPCAPG
jgi:hypothetical protein